MSFFKGIIEFSKRIINLRQPNTDPFENSKWICSIRRICFILGLSNFLLWFFDYTVYFPGDAPRPVSGLIRNIFEGDLRIYLVAGWFILMVVFTFISFGLIKLRFLIKKENTKERDLIGEYWETSKIVILDIFLLFAWIWLCGYDAYLLIEQINGSKVDILDSIVVVFSTFYSVYVYIYRQFKKVYHYVFDKKNK